MLTVDEVFPVRALRGWTLAPGVDPNLVHLANWATLYHGKPRNIRIHCAANSLDVDIAAAWKRVDEPVTCILCFGTRRR